MDWSYFDKFEDLTGKYLPSFGEGDTMASQIVTAVCKLVFKWYNDGDVYDNTGHLAGWCNDLSSYANWLLRYTPADKILYRVGECKNDEEYERLLADLADLLLTEKYLDAMNGFEKFGSVYDCDGPFKFVDPDAEDEDDCYYGCWDDEPDEDEEEEESYDD